MKKDSEIYANKLDAILGNKKKFKRFLILLLIVGVFGVVGISAWKGCTIETKNSKFNVKSRPIK